jgi:hypothetical protein
MVRPFVLRDYTEHLSQPLQALSRIARLTERGFGSLVLGREVGRHDAVDPEDYSSITRRRSVAGRWLQSTVGSIPATHFAICSRVQR